MEPDDTRQYRRQSRARADFLAKALIALGLLAVLYLSGATSKGKALLPQNADPASPPFAQALPAGTFPGPVREGPGPVRAAYQFAGDRQNHALLKALDCYCGCRTELEHQNLRDCFVQKLLPGSKSLYEPHGLGCDICLDEILEAERLAASGKTFKAIKDRIRAKFALTKEPSS